MEGKRKMKTKQKIERDFKERERDEEEGRAFKGGFSLKSTS